MGDDERLNTDETAELNIDDMPTIRASEEAEIVELPPQVGHFRIVRKIGEGGMGVVFEAEQDRPRRRVALKAIRAESTTSDTVKRFEKELHVLGQLHHPGIAEIYEAGTVDTPHGARPYFAMEFVEGDTLTTYAKKHDLNARQRLALMAKICDAVQHAHQRGVVHRDLKPGNILVVDTERSTDGAGSLSTSSSDAESVGQPKILDFGVARATDLDLQVTLQTDLGQIIGTVPYMSPEQVGGDPHTVDVRSDVYALGVIAYELLAGHLPYQVWRKPIQEAARIICEQEPSRLRTVHRQFRGDIETIVGKALEKERERRYQSAEEMAADIRRYLTEQPVMARPPSSAYQLRKFARRNKGLVAGIAVALLVLVVGSAVSTWQAIRAVRGERRAAEEALTANQVADFLANLFEIADPMQVRNDAVSVREVLDQGATRVRQDLADQPRVQARLMSVIGGVYTRLALFDEAQPLLSDALELREELLGPQSKEVAETANSLGNLHRHIGEWDQARRLYRKALSIYESTDPPDLAGIATLVNNLAIIDARTGDPVAAAEGFRRVLEMREQVYGPENPEVATALDNLANAENEAGNLAQAREYSERALQIRQKSLGPDHPDVALSLDNLGILLTETAEYREARALHVRALEIRERTLGDTHPEVAASLNNIAWVDERLADLESARALYQRALKIAEHVHGTKHPTYAMFLQNTGIVSHKLGDLAAARSAIEEALRIRTETLGPGHPFVGATMGSLANVLADLGQLDEAAGLRERSLVIFENSVGESHPAYAEALSHLGELRAQSGDLAAAESHQRRALEIQESTLGPDHPSVANTLFALGSVLVATGDAVEAEACFWRCFDIRVDTFGEDHPQVAQVRNTLADLTGTP